MGNDYFNDDYECYECGAKMKKSRRGGFGLSCLRTLSRYRRLLD